MTTFAKTVKQQSADLCGQHTMKAKKCLSYSLLVYSVYSVHFGPSLSMEIVLL